ncbi:MAG: PhzF family phenazine biosynthesis protein [Alphaproteobacteria bacterium]
MFNTPASPAPLRYALLDVFTRRPFCGNPLAVFEDSDGLSTRAMQSIAGEWNLSESVFLHRPRDENAVASLRIFTPRVEVPFAGHPTLGAAAWLLLRGLGGGEVFSLETQSGLVAIEARLEHGSCACVRMMAPRRARRIEGFGSVEVASAAVAHLLGLAEEDLDTRYSDSGAIFSAGVPFFFVALKSDALARARAPEERAVEMLWPEEAYRPSGIYALSLPDSESGSGNGSTGKGGIRARMFAPHTGITEDPATGSAVCALSGWLEMHGLEWGNGEEVVIMQGVEMGRPSEIGLMRTGAGGVRLGGCAVFLAEGELRADALTSLDG